MAGEQVMLRGGMSKRGQSRSRRGDCCGNGDQVVGWASKKGKEQRKRLCVL